VDAGHTRLWSDDTCLEDHCRQATSKGCEETQGQCRQRPDRPNRIEPEYLIQFNGLLRFQRAQESRSKPLRSNRDANTYLGTLSIGSVIYHSMLQSPRDIYLSRGHASPLEIVIRAYWVVDLSFPLACAEKVLEAAKCEFTSSQAVLTGRVSKQLQDNSCLEEVDCRPRAGAQDMQVNDWRI
jgi:hypothetical protein